MKILIVDDHPLFLAGFRQVLNDYSTELEIFEAQNYDAALSTLKHHPDMRWIFLDLQMPGVDGLHLLSKLRDEKITAPIVILSANERPEVVHRALAAGANAYISKSSSKAELFDAISAIDQHPRYVSPNLRATLSSYRNDGGSDVIDDLRLTQRQLAVLELVAIGDSNQDIAQKLNLSESTIKGHLSTLFDLLGVNNRTECARTAIKNGLILQ